MRLPRARTQSRLGAANQAKIAALEALAEAYLRWCHQDTTAFCAEAPPDKFAAPDCESPLSQRWQRVASQHAAGSAQSWRAKHAAA